MERVRNNNFRFSVGSKCTCAAIITKSCRENIGKQCKHLH